MPAVADKSLDQYFFNLVKLENLLWLKLFKYNLNDLDSTKFGLVQAKRNSATATTGLPLLFNQDNS